MERLAGKAIKNPNAMVELQDLYTEWKKRQDEIQTILEMVENDPEFFEISEEEAIMDDCQKVLEDITNKILLDQNNN
jgi:protein subunit release factor A